MKTLNSLKLELRKPILLQTGKATLSTVITRNTCCNMHQHMCMCFGMYMF